VALIHAAIKLMRTAGARYSVRRSAASRVCPVSASSRAGAERHFAGSSNASSRAAAVVARASRTPYGMLYGLAARTAAS
jgi:hypothetical protein